MIAGAEPTPRRREIELYHDFLVNLSKLIIKSRTERLITRSILPLKKIELVDHFLQINQRLL
jgi:uncharacterized protein YqiB (DUF1249 family)